MQYKCYNVPSVLPDVSTNEDQPQRGISQAMQDKEQVEPEGSYSETSMEDLT